MSAISNIPEPCSTALPHTCQQCQKLVLGQNGLQGQCQLDEQYWFDEILGTKISEWPHIFGEIDANCSR